MNNGRRPVQLFMFFDLSNQMLFGGICETKREICSSLKQANQYFLANGVVQIFSVCSNSHSNLLRFGLFCLNKKITPREVTTQGCNFGWRVLSKYHLWSWVSLLCARYFLSTPWCVKISTGANETSGKYVFWGKKARSDSQKYLSCTNSPKIECFG